MIGLFVEKKLKVSVVELCMGGFICNKFINVSGVFEVFDRGFIVYLNEVKMKLFGVLE